MKKAKVYMHDIWAGTLTEDDEGYHFKYEKKYLESSDAEAVSLTFPLKGNEYNSNILFSFFDGLIPEGWLLEIAKKNWKIDPRDRMSVLLETCRECIGAVSIEPID
jgi:serine/threonine-protein kinase HipA